MITIVPPIGRPSAIAGQGSTSTCHRRVVEEVDVACGAGSAATGAAGAGAVTGAGAGAGGAPPPFILTMYETKWLRVGWSDNTKSSSTGKENISRTSPIISACLTVSIPNSPSRSWSISMKSSG